MSSLRICLVSEEQEGWGGIGTYTAVLARGLRDLGHAVHLILRDWEADRREQLDGIAVHRLTVPEPSWRRGTERFVEQLHGAREALVWSRRVAGRVRAIAAHEGLDVVEMPEHRGAGAVFALTGRGPGPAPGPVPEPEPKPELGPGARMSLAFARRRLRAHAVPLVVRLHTPAFLTERVNEQREDALDRRAVELLERLAARRADLLTAPSAAVAQAVQVRWGVPAERVAVIPNPVDDDLFSPVDGSAAPERPVVLCVARLERIKGVDVLVEALPQLLARHPGVRVRLVGEDDPNGHQGGSMAAHLRERARALGVPAGALEIRGALARRELPALLRQATVCVVPSRWENLPYACLEAMACARPVVASRVGGLGELISDGVDGLLVAPEDGHALAGAICRVLEDRSLAERLAACARTTTLRRFGQRAVACRVAAAYETLRAR